MAFLKNKYLQSYFWCLSKFIVEFRWYLMLMFFKTRHRSGGSGTSSSYVEAANILSAPRDVALQPFNGDTICPRIKARHASTLSDFHMMIAECDKYIIRCQNVILSPRTPQEWVHQAGVNTPIPPKCAWQSNGISLKKSKFAHIPQTIHLARRLDYENQQRIQFAGLNHRDAYLTSQLGSFHHLTTVSYNNVRENLWNYLFLTSQIFNGCQGMSRSDVAFWFLGGFFSNKPVTANSMAGKPNWFLAHQWIIDPCATSRCNTDVFQWPVPDQSFAQDVHGLLITLNGCWRWPSGLGC